MDVGPDATAHGDSQGLRQATKSGESFKIPCKRGAWPRSLLPPVPVVLLFLPISGAHVHVHTVTLTQGQRDHIRASWALVVAVLPRSGCPWSPDGCLLPKH